MLTRRTLVTLAAAVTIFAAQPAGAQDKSIVVASTTSTQDSACSGTSCRSLRRRPASTSKSLRRAPARRSTPENAATPTWCSFTPEDQKRNLSPTVSV